MARLDHLKEIVLIRINGEGFGHGKGKYTSFIPLLKISILVMFFIDTDMLKQFYYIFLKRKKNGFCLSGKLLVFFFKLNKTVIRTIIYIQTEIRIETHELRYLFQKIIKEN